jgi:hypothetical protein
MHEGVCPDTPDRFLIEPFVFFCYKLSKISKIIFQEKNVSLIIKNIPIIIGLYIIVLFFSFVSEYTYKKKSFSEIKENAKSIIFEATIIFIVMIIASIIYFQLGIKAD